MQPLLIGMGWFDYQKGGLNKYFQELSDVMESKGIDFRALAGHKFNKKIADKRYSFAINNFFFKRLYNVKIQTDKILSDFQPNIVNFHFALTALPVLKHKKLYNLPKVFNFQGPWAFEGLKEDGSYKGIVVSKIKFLIERKVYSQIDKFIVLSNAFKKILNKSYSIPMDKINVIPPGVNIDKYKLLNISKSELREAMNLPQDRFIIFTVRRLVKRMGLFNLLKAVSLVKKKNKDIYLIIGGKGYLYYELQKFIDEHNLKNYVRLLGFIKDEDLIKYYNLADITVMPTDALEGFGLVTLESLSCGTPVMGTPVDANLESIGNFNKELLFRDKTPEAISEGIIEVLNGRIKLPSRKECREYVIKNFSWDIIFQKVIKSWKELL